MTFTTRPELRGTFGMASSTHWLATATAQSVLERGGNAFDAVVAGAFVLHVVEPENNGAGGDLVAIFARGGETARRPCSAGRGQRRPEATIEHYRAEGLELVPGSGALAAAIPGAVDAWLLLLRDHGTWELADVLAYAIGYARDGHPAGERLVGVIAAAARDVHRPLDHLPRPLDAGRRAGRRRAAAARAQYAATLERIVAESSAAAGPRGPNRQARGGCGDPGSWPTRSTRSCARRTATLPAATMPVCCGRATWPDSQRTTRPR